MYVYGREDEKKSTHEVHDDLCVFPAGMPPAAGNGEPACGKD